MNRKLLNLIDEGMPDFNPVYTEGFHQKEFEYGHVWFDRALRSILKSVERKGVFFRGCTPADPKEFIDHLISSSRKIFDAHKETLYPVGIDIDYVDKGGKTNNFRVYTMLPYTNLYGDVFLRGAFYNAQYVLAERGLPVTKENSIFVKVLGYKFKIGTENFNMNQIFTDAGTWVSRGYSTNLAANRFYSPTEARKIKDTKTPTPLLAWYIFAKMGFSKAMEQYGECDYRIGPIDALVEECRPEDRWEIFARTNNKGINEKYLGEFIALDTAIAVRNLHANRPALSAMALQYMSAMMFVIDCCSSHFDIDRIDEPSYWKLLIGRCSVKAGDTDEYIMRLIDQHFETINEYLDEDSIKRFAGQSIVVANMFDLFNYIIANRSEIVQTTNRASAFHKELASLEFMLDSLLTAANNFKYDIKNNSEINFKKVGQFLTSHFHIKEIDNARNANLIQEATPTDNPFIDYGLGCMPQHKVYTGIGKQKKGDFDVNDSATFTDASLPFVFSCFRVNKPNPDGRGYLSPTGYLIDGKTTALDPEQKPLFERTDHRLRNREPWP